MNMLDKKIFHFSDVTFITETIRITAGITKQLQTFTSDSATTCKILVFSPQMERNAFMLVTNHAKVMVCIKTLQEINVSLSKTCECTEKHTVSW